MLDREAHAPGDQPPGHSLGVAYLDKVLSVKEGLQQAIDGVLGPVEKKVRKGREAAKTCPVCLRDIMLDADGKIAEVTIFWRPLPSAVEMQGHLALDRDLDAPGDGYCESAA